MKKKSTLLFALIAFIAIQNCFSQTQTALRSIASGNWSAFATVWEKTGSFYNPTPTWAAATAAPTTSQIAIIRNGHTVTIDASGKNSKSVIVEAGGKLFANGVANSVRVGAIASGTAGSIDTLTVDGIFGGTGELLPLEFQIGAASTWIRGTGTIEIGRIRPVNGNLNYTGSAATNAATGFKLLVDKDITLNTAGNSVFSVTNSTPSVNDSISYTIFAGRKVTVASVSSYFHNNNIDGTTKLVAAGGKYEYRINGTLDLSANISVAGGNTLVPYSNASSALTLNVNGLLKLGGYFKADTVGNSLGALNININNGGVIDATLTSKLITGTVGAVTATPSIYFKISGTGTLKRTVTNDGAKILFPIGTASYTPVTISGNTGAAEVFTVSIKDAITNTAPANTLQKEWNIAESVAGGNLDTLRFQWTVADQTMGFTGANPVFVGRWNGSAWDFTAASVSGTGTTADPYVAKSTPFSTFGLFILSNNGVAPVSFVNVKAYQKLSGAQIEFGNATELDIAKYEIEKSTNVRVFSTLSTLLPKTNNAALNNYSYFDASISNGNNFYRIKVTEKDGTIKYSTILNIKLSQGSGIVIYPNPIKGKVINVQFQNTNEAMYQIHIFNQIGQTIYTQQLQHTGRTAAYVVALPANIAKGIYSVQISNNSVKTTQKIIVE